MVGVVAMAKDFGSGDEPRGSGDDDSERKPESGVRFGHEVRRRREAQDMTLEELSERCGLTPNYIGTVENGKRDPSLSTILALAQGIGMPAGEFFRGVPDLSAMACEAARLFDRSRPDLQEAIFKFLRAIARLRRT